MHFKSLSQAQVLGEPFRLCVIPSLVSEMSSVLELDHSFQDIRFKSHSSVFYGHKVVLWSGYFGRGVLELVEEMSLSASVRPESFKAFLKYLYMGYVDVNQIPNYVKKDLLELAKANSLLRLQNICLHSSIDQQILAIPPIYSFEPALNSPKFSDFVFLLRDHTIYAHKVFLLARCEYFRNLFAAEPKQREVRVGKIGSVEVRVETLMSFLKWVYTDHLSVSSPDHLKSLLLFGSYYKAFGLLSLLKNFGSNQQAPQQQGGETSAVGGKGGSEKKGTLW
eukprot:CAMPEP_0174251480 /NCGR_PEP_ID=MMETSP0439-20130205/1293_1 /TAXON_ID=0 /ORGANISM="Stereomyxa ramosa, Strain Chinc5" /LENGTH=278 /DNA_ID=CAMNT_0015331807 /DNA_START=795 /DNA_END=1628 /DNA_ORIENTATION=+